MSSIKTKRLLLVPHAPEALRALVIGVDDYERVVGLRLADGVRDFLVSADTSAEFRARLQAATESDIWTLGCALVHVADGAVIGMCGYKGPPDADGMVEIGYGVAPGYRNQGYATEAAQALTDYALQTGHVSIVRAHTLPESNASTKVLAKCGFARVAEVVDPDDGPVWRWELKQDSASPA